MSLLLDTHIFLWAFGPAHRLTEHVQAVLENPDNVLFLSVASMGEMQIKVQLGKLDLPMPVQEFVAIQQVLNHIQPLPIFDRHIWAL